jgi:hypothetical protein
LAVQEHELCVELTQPEKNPKAASRDKAKATKANARAKATKANARAKAKL